MGKDGGFLTPKAISNRIKAKGLQKLKFYCQMCEKQCRDANGFKCHCLSESHRRQMELVASGHKKFTDTFSIQFEREFMNIVRTRHKTKRVRANQVYNEYIQDRNHVHMNSTRWTTLTEFTHYLARQGKVTAEETPKGLYLRFIDRDELARQEENMKKKKAVLDDEQRARKAIEKQKARAAELESQIGISGPSETTALQREASDQKIAFSFGTKANSKPKSSLFEDEDEEEEEETKRKETKNEKPEETDEPVASSSGRKRKTEGKSDDLSSAPPKKKSRTAEVLPYWLHKDIIVKVKVKSLASGKYYKQKGIVTKVANKYAAKVKMLKSGDALLLDQEHVETVIPAIGGTVLIVNGKYRGEQGILKELNVEAFSGIIEMLPSKECVSLPYEHFCKLHTK